MATALAGVRREAIRYCLSSFLYGFNMRLIELFEAKTDKKKVVKSPPPRNFVAKNAQTTGAGAHKDTKFSRKEKHKKKPKEV